MDEWLPFFHEKIVVVLINQTICDYNKGPFNSQDLNTNSPFCLAYISFLFKCWEFGVESYDISFSWEWEGNVQNNTKQTPDIGTPLRGPSTWK